MHDDSQKAITGPEPQDSVVEGDYESPDDIDLYPWYDQPRKVKNKNQGPIGESSMVTLSFLLDTYTRLQVEPLLDAIAERLPTSEA